MQNDHSAFLASEIVLLKDRSALEEIKRLCTTESPLSLHNVLPDDMTRYAGERMDITGVSYYHMGFVLYELRQIGGPPVEGHWPEAALLDQELERADEHELFGLAADRYEARPSNDGSLVEIRDRGDRLLCALRMNEVERSVQDINRVASLRCSYSFARRYNFEDDLGR